MDPSIDFQTLTISLLLVWLFAKLLYKPSCRSKKLAPSPPKLPLLGNLLQLSRLPHRDLHRLAQKHGPLMLLHFGSMPTLVVSSVDGAREVMKNQDVAFSDRPESSLAKRLLYNYKDVSFSPYGEYWRQLKSICVLQLLSNRRVQSFHHIREEETALLVKKIRESSSSGINLSEMLTQLTNDVVCRSAFGRKFGQVEKGKKLLSLLSEFMEVLATSCIGDFVPCLSWISRLNGFDAKVDRIAKEMDEFLEDVIKERTTYANQNGDNFLDILLHIYHNNSCGVSIDRDSVKGILLDVFAAGTDTTSTVSEWGMAELLRNPNTMQRLQNEVREIVKGNRHITNNDLEEMHYLKAVIKETLRLHTPIPLLVPRVARKDVKVMGYDILAGTMVMINAWAIGRDPAIWDEPQKFNPERFLNSSIDF